MIENIKLKQYKGIPEGLILENLEQLNIICGRNNSGKSSILEAINDKNYRWLGKTIRQENLSWWILKYQPIADRHGNPVNYQSRDLMSQYLQDNLNKIFFENEGKTHAANFSKAFRDRYRQNYTENTFGIEPYLNSCFENDIRSFRPILIPPKRNLETQLSIKFSETLPFNGSNLINHLLFLRNQDPHSKDFKTYDEIYNTFSDITGGYYFNIAPTKSDVVSISFSKDLKTWIKGESSGLGLRDILIILSFIIDFDYNFIMIEEAENHIHPELQRRLLRYLRSRNDKQFLLTTHSNVFLDTSYVDQIYFTEIKDTVSLSNKTNKANILTHLGYTVVDNLVSDLVILTEGSTDFPVIDELCKKLNLPDSFIIKWWPLNGDMMDQLDLTLILEKTTTLAIVDSDPNSTLRRKKFIANCKKYGIDCTKLTRYSIENYFSLEAIKKVFPGRISNEIKALDPEKKVEDQIGFSVKKNARDIIQSSSLDDFKNTDLLKFCNKVKTMLEQK